MKIWLVECGADLMNRFVVCEDGRAAHGGLKGRKLRDEVVEFVRKMMYRIPDENQRGRMDGAMGT